MMNSTLTQTQVITQAVALPGFPRVVNLILESLDDPELNLNVLVDCIAHDPLIAARVLSFASRAADRTRNIAGVRDIYTATSLIGMSHVRQIAMVSSLGQFFARPELGHSISDYWQHSVAVGVCAQELALYITAPINSDTALIAGLLHDIGQLWLNRFYPGEFQQARMLARLQNVGLEKAELDIFGVDHAEIGAWLAEYWGLPSDLVSAIRYHDQPEAEIGNLIVQVVSVAEVLANALDLAGSGNHRVSHISSAACKALDLVFDTNIQPLFGRIEARSKYANVLFVSERS